MYHLKLKPEMREFEEGGCVYQIDIEVKVEKCDPSYPTQVNYDSDNPGLHAIQDAIAKMSNAMPKPGDTFTHQLNFPQDQWVYNGSPLPGTIHLSFQADMAEGRLPGDRENARVMYDPNEDVLHVISHISAQQNAMQRNRRDGPQWATDAIHSEVSPQLNVLLQSLNSLANLFERQSMA
tara:strand:- start:123 stop:659 length:537 start_codon:yes stop_codon:yes gene_type:complete